MDSRLFYVTVRDAGKTGWLLGPYADHQTALDNVARGRELAGKADPFSAFYAFGTASLPKDLPKHPKTVFGE